jgi:hypothetical protein
MNTDDQKAVSVGPLDVIRVETALSRFPLHQLAKSGLMPIEIREVAPDGEVTLQWRVSPNDAFGPPGPLAYKLDTLVVNRRLERAGRPLPELVRLGGLKEILRELGLTNHDTQAIRKALHQNASAYITAKIKYRSVAGTERRIEIGGTRYTVVMTGERLPDGRPADAVYLLLHPFFREILDCALRRPLDFDYLHDLSPIGQRWYELVSFRMFAALKHRQPTARLSYAEFCLLAPQRRSEAYGPMRKQMHKVHAPHLRSGYLAGVEFEATTDRTGRPDWTLIYTPGPKARAEYQAFTQRGGPVARDVASAPAPPALRPPPEPDPTPLERELIDRGVTPRAARELARAYPEAQIRAQVEHVDWLRAHKPRQIADVGAYLASAIRENYAAPGGLVRAAQRSAQAAAEHERQEQARRAQARAQEHQARVEAYWAGLSPEEQARIDRAALEQAGPEQRAHCQRGPEFLRRMNLRALRGDYIRTLLGLAAPAGPEEP